jgi:hypothetical protein
MKINKPLLALVLIASAAFVCHAQIFGTVRGTVLDPQGAVISGASVTLKAHASAFEKTTQTDVSGSFTFTAVPADSYTVVVAHAGFETQTQTVSVAILSAPTLRFSLALGKIESSISVTAEAPPVNLEASSPPVTIEESDILHTPGADRAASIAFITDYVPGSFLLHDHLHMRGGHQVSWLVDGVRYRTQTSPATSGANWIRKTFRTSRSLAEDTRQNMATVLTEW